MSIIKPIINPILNKILKPIIVTGDLDLPVGVLLETGDNLLLEDGSKILVENDIEAAIKISEMVDAGAVLGTDDILVERAGSNVRVNVNQIFTDILTKQDISEKGAANGYASLDANATIPINQLDDSHSFYRDFIFDLNLGKTNGWYQFIQSAANVPSNFPSGSSLNILHVFQYQNNNGVQIIYSADRDSASTYVLQYIRAWEGASFTNWFQATLTEII